MSFSLDLPTRLAYLRIEPMYKEDLAQIWTLIEPALDEALNIFYTHVGA